MGLADPAVGRKAFVEDRLLYVEEVEPLRKWSVHWSVTTQSAVLLVVLAFVVHVHGKEADQDTAQVASAAR